MKAIEIDNVSFRYGRNSIFTDLSLSVEQSEKVALYGPSRSGKTLLLLIAGGNFAPAAGSVTINGRNMRRERTKSRSAVGLGCVQNVLKLDDDITILENLQFQASLLLMSNPHNAAVKALKKVGIIDSDRPARELSQYEFSEVSLAMALLSDPAVILLDEPTEKLTSEEAEAFWILAEGLLDTRTVMFTTHDRAEAEKHADWIFSLGEERNIS